MANKICYYMSFFKKYVCNYVVNHKIWDYYLNVLDSEILCLDQKPIKGKNGAIMQLGSSLAKGNCPNCT